MVDKQDYLPRLDGLSAISIALVLVEHFLWSGHQVAAAGVTLFFVISGFLITSILMSYKDTFSLRNAAVVFYSRRALRLFPIYYLTIMAMAAFNIGGLRHTWLINALYLGNFKLAIDGKWNGASHFWSLAIEEQFYLIWFLVVMTLPHWKIRPVIVSCIVVAPIFRWVMWMLGSRPFIDLLLPGVMDSLASGALLAYLVRHSRNTVVWRHFMATRMHLLLACLCGAAAIQVIGSQAVSRVGLRCCVNFASLCLVALAIDRTSDWRVDWLGGRAIRHFGKISYGIYVYHFFVPAIMDPHLHLEWARGYHLMRILRLFVLTAISVGIAEISWHLIELPLLKLKATVPLFGGVRNAGASTMPKDYTESKPVEARA